jgi:WD40 repeat protein
MTGWRRAVVPLFALLAAARAPGAPPAPPGDPAPVLQAEPPRPRAAVTSLAFAPGGPTLYAAGYDKVVRSWKVTPDGLVPRPTVYRVPVGPGVQGAIGAMAVSPDGDWLAVAGNAVTREAAGFREPGMWAPVAGLFGEAHRLDQGTVYVFDTRSGLCRGALRGHRGVVLAAAFAPPRPGQAPHLVTAAREWDERARAYRGGVRVWDVAKGAEVAARTDLPDPVEKDSLAPGLALALTGRGGGTGLLVGLAWKDGKARLWDVDGGAPEEADDGPLNYTAAPLPAEGLFCTGSYRGGAARARGWATRNGRLAPGPEVKLDDSRGCSVGALAVLRRAKGEGDDLAVVLCGADEYRLQIVGLANGLGEASRKRTVRLGPGGGRQPVLAASPDGRYLALAGYGRNAVQVLDTSRPDGELREAPGTAGVPVRGVGFVRKGGGLGLSLDDGRDVVVFDADARRLVDAAGWAPDAPDLAGWKVAPLPPDAAGRPGAAVTRDGEAVGEIRLGPRQEATMAALRPGRRPLLAVAVMERGVPYLSLYDVASGQPVRVYTGHTGRIGSLAFSGDGRLLASAADDRTVCVWSLADLGEILGQKGVVRGLTVHARGGVLEVGGPGEEPLSGANRRALDAAGVARGDVIEGLVEGGRLTPLDSPKAFYEALWKRPPGARVTLRVRGRGDIPLVLDQATDERKPLFTFFQSGNGHPDQRGWVGWSPLGPYDVSDAGGADALVVWHKNTGKPDAPAVAAPLDRYKKEYYRKDVLRTLLKHASLAAALRELDAPPPRPRMTLRLGGPGTDDPPRDAHGNPVFRQPPKSLAATVTGITPDRVDAVEWEVDGGPRRPFECESETTFEAELAGLRWDRGEHTFRLVVRATDPARTEFSEALRVRYAPAPPRVELAAPEKEVKEAKFTVRGRVLPGLDGPGAPRVKAVLYHNGDRYDVAGPDVAQEVTLKRGENRFELRAENEGATPDSREWEAADPAVAKVVFAPDPEPPPVLLLDTVCHGRGDEAAPPADKVLVVHGPTIHVRGRVLSKAKLAAVELDGRAVKFTGGGPDYAFDAEVRLKPGPQDPLRFGARTAEARAEPRALRLTYHPDLPRFTRDRPGPEREGNEPLAVALEGRLSVPPDVDPSTKARVSLNGGEPADATIDLRKGTLRASLLLRPGPNVITVTILNDYWSRTEELAVYCKRPPRVGVLRHTEVGKEPAVDLTARVESPLALTGARLAVARPDGRGGVQEERVDLPPGAWAKDGDDWVVTVRGLRLVEGENKVRLYARNRDGESPEPGGDTVRWTKPLPPRPEVRITTPAVDETVSAPRCAFAFRVKSEGPVRRVAVYRGDEELKIKLESRAESEGVTIYETRELPLKQGPNRLIALAENEGGPAQSDARTVSFTRQPVAIRLEGLALQEEGGLVLAPARLEGGLPVFGAPAPDGRMWLRGHVEFGDASQVVDGRQRVRVLVNGFEQLDAALDAREGLRRAFRVPIRLNRLRDNLVQVDVPDLKLPSRPAFRVDCAAPLSDQRLHLLVLGPGEPDQAALRRAVIAALQGRDVRGNRFATPAFREGELFGLPEDFQREDVTSALLRIRDRVRANTRPLNENTRPLNDVVIVYFRGEEALTDDGQHYLLTEATRLRGRPAETAVDSAEMRKLLADVPGAKLLLLDGSSASGDEARVTRVRLDNSAPQVGVLEYLWLGKQKTPEEARLITALQESLARAGVLLDVKRQVGERAKKPYPGGEVRFKDNISADVGLASLRVGAP